MLKVLLPDGSVREYDRSVCPMDVAAEIGTGLAKATLGAVLDGEIKGAYTQLPESQYFLIKEYRFFFGIVRIYSLYIGNLEIMLSVAKIACVVRSEKYSRGSCLRLT